MTNIKFNILTKNYPYHSLINMFNVFRKYWYDIIVACVILE